MKSSFRNRSLFQQFTISFVITIFIPIMVIGGISYIKGTVQIKNMVRELLEQLTSNINSQLDMIINDNDWLSLQIANKTEVRRFIELGPDEYYQKYQFRQWIDKEILLDEIFTRFPIINRVSVIGDKGAVYSSHNTGTWADIQDLYDSNDFVKRAAYYKQALPSDGSIRVMLDKYLDSGSEEYYVTISRRIFSMTPFKTNGVLLIDIKTSSLSKVFGNMDLKNCTIWIINNNGQVVYYPDEKIIGSRFNDFFDHEELNETTFSFTDIWNGKKSFFVCIISKKTGWKVVAEIPIQQLNMPLNDLGRVILYTFLFALPVALLVGYLFIRSILKPIHYLERDMKKIGDGKWKKLEGEIPKNEIGNLMNVYNNMIQVISDLIEKVYKAELRQREYQLSRQKTEFQALQTQINPHFLYNTLSAIHTYALMAEDQDIQEMVEALSKMLRYSVQDPFELVSLKNEIEHVNYFLTIQSHRNKNMPKVEWDMEPYIDFPIIRLTLQPLVENVFKHAFPDGIKPGYKISISAVEESDFFIIDVSDNGCGMIEIDSGIYYTPECNKIKLGIGLKNVHRRIQIAYGSKYGLVFCGNTDKGLTVRMLLPSNRLAVDIEQAII